MSPRIVPIAQSLLARNDDSRLATIGPIVSVTRHDTRQAFAVRYTDEIALDVGISHSVLIGDEGLRRWNLVEGCAVGTVGADEGCVTNKDILLDRKVVRRVDSDCVAKLGGDHRISVSG